MNLNGVRVYNIGPSLKDAFEEMFRKCQKKYLRKLFSLSSQKRSKNDFVRRRDSFLSRAG